MIDREIPHIDTPHLPDPSTEQGRLIMKPHMER